MKTIIKRELKGWVTSKVGAVMVMDMVMVLNSVGAAELPLPFQS